MSDIPDTYLGDGVYASFDGYQVVLDLRGQDDTTKISLEPAVFQALLSYKKQLDEATQGKRIKTTDAEPEWRQQLNYALDCEEEGLSSWEVEFIESLSMSASHVDFEPSDKQLAVLRDIDGKLP